ncbi:MAG: hypothetical protein ACE5IK_07950 [Acidobacteriota bacterium]
MSATGHPSSPHAGTRAFVVIGLLVAGSCAAAGAIRSYDFGWHLAAGESILDAGGRPPRVDPLSHTPAGQDWVDHEWLFEAGLAGVVRHGGLVGAWLLKHGAAWLMVGVGAMWLLGRGVAPWLVALILAIALEGARFRLAVRPELAGLALLPLLLFCLDRARRARDETVIRWLAAVPVLVVAWVNLHPSALLAVGLTAVFSAGVAVENRRDRRRTAAFLLCPVLAGVCLLANPYGIDILRVPLRIHAALGIEGVSNPEWGSAVQRPFWMFWVIGLAGIGAAVHAIRGHRRLDWPMLMVGLTLGVGSGLALRLLGFFYVALPWVAASLLPPRASSSRRPVVAASVPVAAALFFLLLPRPLAAGVGPHLAPGRFPEAMAASFRNLSVRGPLYNPVRFGGYLSWRLHPERVFLDGRNELHAVLLARVADCRRRVDVGCWDHLLDEWDVQAAIVEYDPRRLKDRLPDGRVVTRSAASVWFRSSRWALIDWDDTAMLYVRRSGANAPLVAAHEQHWLTPDDAGGFIDRLAEGRIDIAAAREEAHRQAMAHPDSSRLAALTAILDGRLRRPRPRTRPDGDTERPPN